MEFDWTTFALEVINFLVLVWLLKHFFYRPVLAVIERRQAATAKTLADAEAVRGEAERLRAECGTRLAGIEQERVAARARLDQEIAAERARRLAAVAAEAEAEAQRRRMRAVRADAEAKAALEREAVSVATRFASRFLERLAGPEMTAQLADLAIEDLDALAPDRLDALRDPGAGVKVVSAHPLDAARRDAFTRALSRLTGRPLAPEFSDDPLLKAGVCVMAGAWVLMANLRDELAFFGGSLEHEG